MTVEKLVRYTKKKVTSWIAKSKRGLCGPKQRGRMFIKFILH